MKRSELRSLSRGSVPGATTQLFSNDLVNSIFEMAVLDIVSKTKCLPAEINIDAVEDQTEYDIPTDFLCMDESGLWFNTGDETDIAWTELYAITKRKLDLMFPNWRTSSTGVPQYYYQEADKIVVYGAPSADLTDGFLLYYIQKPTPMTSDTHYPFVGSTTERPTLSIYDEAIVEFFKWRANSILNKAPEAVAAKQIYDVLVERKNLDMKARLDINEGRLGRFRVC